MTDVRVAERTLPHNLEAERAVLGAILLQNQQLHEVADTVTPWHFFRDAHRRIFNHMLALSVTGAPIDLVSVKESLGRSGELEQVGGPSYVSALIDGVARSTNVRHYARIVREKSDLREVIYACNKLLVRAYDAEDDARDVVEEAERAIFQIAEGATRQGFVASSSLVGSLMNKLEVLHQTKQGVTGIASGYRDLDDLTRGFQPGNLILIAARPSQGKSALAQNIAENVSAAGQTVGFFSLEMSAEELLMRQLASTARIDSHRIQSGYFGERDFTHLAHAIGVMSASKFFIDETPNLGVFEMRARAHRLKAEHGLDLLIVDYIQLTSNPQRGKVENRTLELGQMSRALKILARELGIPVIVLSQLSRAPELRSDHRPILSDLRESGSLEQDADVVIFIYRDEYYHPDRDDNHGIAELIISKQRNGPIGTVKLAFLREFTRFENLATEPTYEDRRLPMGDR